MSTFNTTVVQLSRLLPHPLSVSFSLTLSLALFAATTPRCRPLATLVAAAAAVLNFVVFHAHQTSSDNCCIYLGLVALSRPAAPPTPLPPDHVSAALRSGSLCSLACRSARLIGYEQLSDWFYWVAFVMCSGCLCLGLGLSRCLSRLRTADCGSAVAATRLRPLRLRLQLRVRVCGWGYLYWN